MGTEELFDLTIIGGGPTGLYAAYYAGLRGLKAKILDSLPELGGQLIAIYPEKHVYDVPGFPAILARDLAANLIRQALEYHPAICLNERIASMDRTQTPAGIEFRLRSERQNVHRSRAILVTVGLGAFSPKTLDIPDLTRFEAKGVAYFLKSYAAVAGKKVLIVGGGDSAIDWATNLSGIAGEITLIHRRLQFRAHEESVSRLRTLPVVIKVPYELKAVHGEDRITGATVMNNLTGETETIETDVILLSLGFHSTFGDLKNWGLGSKEESLVVNSRMETSMPGIYAAGDIATFPGKLKLIATGFGEAAIAVNSISKFIGSQ